jgi:predicted nucleic acid-binding protein
MPRVIVDTSVWISFFRGADNLPGQFRELLQSQQLVTCGIVIAELLAGVRNAHERESIETGMAGLDYLEMNQSTWNLVGATLAGLRRAGKTLPVSDVILAALALQLPTATAQEVPRPTDSGFSFAVYGDSRTMMYLPPKLEQK